MINPSFVKSKFTEAELEAAIIDYLSFLGKHSFLA